MKKEELRVYGPPGTGKTTWTAKKAGEYAEKYGSDQVSLCSLTNAAIREVIERKIPVNRENIATLHSRCKRVLFAGKPAEDDIGEFMEDNRGWASTTGMSPCLPAHMVRHVKGRDSNEENFASGQMSLFEYAQILRQQLIPKEKWPILTRQFSDVWEDWCEQTGRMDFTGWLETVLKSGSLPPQQVVFVDEAQDHTPLQLAVIRSWRAHTTILVGDDDQCCYEWSGSVPGEFFKQTENLSGEKVLSQSYRVPRAVFMVADRWVKQIKKRKEKEYHPRDFEGSVTHLNYATNDALFSGELPDGIFDGSGETQMIITSCAYMLDPIIASLKEQRIPFHNPYRPAHAKWNPLRAFNKYIEAFKVGERMWTGNEAWTWAKLLRSKGVFNPRMRGKFLDLCDSLGSQPLTEADIEKYFLQQHKDRILKQDIGFLKDEKGFTKSFDWDYIWNVYESGRHKPKVVVGTIHSVKGGEADNVYLFPDLSAAGLKEYLGTRADRVHRLFYVGVTRARKNLFLCSRSNPFRAISWE